MADDDILPDEPAADQAKHLDANTPLAKIIAIGLLLIGAMGIAAALIIGGLADTLPTDTRTQLVTTAVTASVGALGIAGGLLAKVN